MKKILIAIIITLIPLVANADWFPGKGISTVKTSDGTTVCNGVNQAIVSNGTLSCGSGSATIVTGSGSGGSSANPSATIGLSAVNGSATTFMTSDSAPALSQSITPTWTGLHQFTKADFSLLGTSTGYTLLESGLSSTSNNTLLLPTESSDTLVDLTGTQTLTNKTLTSPTLTTPALGTPSSGNASNLTNLPIILTTTGSSGASTYVQSTNTLNIPQYSGGGSQTPWTSNINGANYLLGTAGINWDSIKNIASSTGINWNNLTMNNFGINWTGYKDLGVQTVNWYDITAVINNLTTTQTGVGNIKLYDSTGINWTDLQAASTIAKSTTFTLPSADGTNNQAIVTNGSGVLSFATIAGSGTVNSGTANQPAYYATSTNAVSTEPDVTFDTTNHYLTIAGAHASGATKLVASNSSASGWAGLYGVNDGNHSGGMLATGSTVSPANAFIFGSFSNADVVNIDVSSNPAIGLDTKGNFQVSNDANGAAPVVSSCGTGSPAATSTSANSAGQVTVGGGTVTSCTITFANSGYAIAPICVASVNSTGVTLGVATTSTVLTVTSSATMNGKVLNWICEGNFQ